MPKYELLILDDETFRIVGKKGFVQVQGLGGVMEAAYFEPPLDDDMPLVSVDESSNYTYQHDTLGNVVRTLLQRS